MRQIGVIQLWGYCTGLFLGQQFMCRQAENTGIVTGLGEEHQGLYGAGKV